MPLAPSAQSPLPFSLCGRALEPKQICACLLSALLATDDLCRLFLSPTDKKLIHPGYLRAANFTGEEKRGKVVQRKFLNEQCEVCFYTRTDFLIWAQETMPGYHRVFFTFRGFEVRFLYYDCASSQLEHCITDAPAFSEVGKATPVKQPRQYRSKKMAKQPHVISPEPQFLNQNFLFPQDMVVISFSLQPPPEAEEERPTKMLKIPSATLAPPEADLLKVPSSPGSMSPMSCLSPMSSSSYDACSETETVLCVDSPLSFPMVSPLSHPLPLSGLDIDQYQQDSHAAACETSVNILFEDQQLPELDPIYSILAL